MSSSSPASSAAPEPLLRARDAPYRSADAGASGCISARGSGAPRAEERRRRAEEAELGPDGYSPGEEYGVVEREASLWALLHPGEGVLGG